MELRVVKKSSPDYNLHPAVRVTDELERIAKDARDRYLGQNWFNEVREFYNLSRLRGATPSFRPQVDIPQLQVLSISEATDLSDASPRIYLADPKTGKRAEAREKAFQQQWRESYVNYYLMFSSLWSQLAGIGFIQIGFDPFANGGIGEIWAHHRDPSTVDIDPGALDDNNWTYLILHERMYPQQIAAGWPETGRDIPALPYTTGESKQTLGYGFDMPPGPMSNTGGLQSRNFSSDGRLDVRCLFLDDRSIEVVNDQAGSDLANGLKTTMKRAYPNGRLVVTVDRHCIADGDNPTPAGWFPIIPIYGLPPLTSFYPPPPIRFSKSLQELAERMLTQTYENAVRVNNAVWFIDENTGISTEAFGGLPGEVQMVNANSRIPELRWPTAMPQHMVELPILLLKLQKELQGFSDARMGTPGAGNISSDLFEASIFQSKRLTRCRARLLARSVHRLSILFYRLMVKHFVSGRTYIKADDVFETVPWEPVDTEARSVNLYIDENSLIPASQAALRQLAPMLRQTGALSTRGLLEALDWPNASDEASRVEREMTLAALNRLRRR